MEGKDWRKEDGQIITIITHPRECIEMRTVATRLGNNPTILRFIDGTFDRLSQAPSWHSRPHKQSIRQFVEREDIRVGSTFSIEKSDPSESM